MGVGPPARAHRHAEPPGSARTALPTGNPTCPCPSPLVCTWSLAVIQPTPYLPPKPPCMPTIIFSTVARVSGSSSSSLLFSGSTWGGGRAVRR